MRVDHITFDIETAQKHADQLDWDIVEWARQADVSALTLRKWLNRDPSIKLRTVDDIVRPLGLTAVELIKKNGKKKT